MRDKEGSGFFGVKGLRDGAKYIHLGYWVIVAKDRMPWRLVSLMQYVKLRKNDDVYFELRN